MFDINNFILLKEELEIELTRTELLGLFYQAKLVPDEQCPSFLPVICALASRNQLALFYQNL